MNRIIRRHIQFLLLAAVIVQAIMFVSYPLGAALHDDNEAAQRYLMSEVASGHFLVGNVRYNTGYAFIMAPFKSLADNLGRFSERALLLLQMAAASAVPFLVYDIMRRRFSPRIALVTATLVLLDPFRLQWAHFWLPGWMIALAAVTALWLAQLAWSASMRRRFILIASAAVILGLMSFARFNFAPLIAVFGLSFFLWTHIALRQRLSLFAAVGLISGGILSAYIALIHIPSTGTTTLSCAAGATLAASLPHKNFQMRASLGPHSANYARMLTLKTERDLSFFGHTYPLWRNPGPWVSEDEQRAFFAQSPGEPQENIDILFPAALYWHMGPCAADALLYDVYFETISSDPAKFAREYLTALFNMLIQHPGEAPFPLQYLDQPREIRWGDPDALGLYPARSQRYKGHRLWPLGASIYSALFPLLNALKILTPLAILAALRQRDWLLTTSAAILLLGLALIAAAAAIEPRYYASLAPLFTLLVGWMLGRLYESLRS